MPKGKNLTEYEKGQIQAFHQSGISNREIARKSKRSHDVVNKYLKNPAAYGSKKRSGRPKKVTPRQQRRIINTASNSTITINKIRREQDLNVSKSTVSRILNSSPHIVRSKMNVAPRLKPHHITNRLEFARSQMDRNWETVSLAVHVRKIFEKFSVQVQHFIYFFIYAFLCFRLSSVMRKSSILTVLMELVDIGEISEKKSDIFLSGILVVDH